MRSKWSYRHLFVIMVFLGPQCRMSDNVAPLSFYALNSLFNHRIESAYEEAKFPL